MVNNFPEPDCRPSDLVEDSLSSGVGMVAHGGDFNFTGLTIGDAHDRNKFGTTRKVRGFKVREFRIALRLQDPILAGRDVVELEFTVQAAAPRKCYEAISRTMFL